MSETKHTPGPWKAALVADMRDDLPSVPTGYVRRHLAEIVGVDSRLNDANALLVSAAPDLLEACITVVNRWESGDLAEAARLCAAAIAKAEGKGN